MDTLKEPVRNHLSAKAASHGGKENVIDIFKMPGLKMIWKNREDPVIDIHRRHDVR